ncbi:MAG TPA: endonuclease/exonuclease/phosphatase family protein [Planctomycetia bacterium]|nr:endonuclease/exonuclease/phosphatase family protein [Planctomycetia bacterium]
MLFAPLAALAALLVPAQAAAPKAGPPAGAVRVATYNIQELSAKKLGEKDASGVGTNAQLVKAAAIVQRVRPDVLLVNEIDGRLPSHTDADNPAVWFRDRYLSIPQTGGGDPLDFPYIYYRPSNTGEPTGIDLDNDGKTDGPNDAFGFGKYPGEYGMALYSRFPLDEKGARTFQKLLWKDVPGHLAPDGSGDRPKYYSEKQMAIFRLSSKSHWDVPVTLPFELAGGGRTLHLLCSHPTPPVFDGAEDKNGRRNFDEVRFWKDYLTDGDAAKYVKDDAGKVGGLAADAPFVILGDLNAEPVRADRAYGMPAIDMILKHPRVKDPRPETAGAAADKSPDLKNFKPYKTSGFGRLDYALPSANLAYVGAGVFWPKEGEPGRDLISPPNPASDHRMVWVDLKIGTPVRTTFAR